MTLTRFIQKWGPEYVAMIAAGVLVVDFVTTEELDWFDFVGIVVLVVFANFFMRKQALLTLPSSMK